MLIQPKATKRSHRITPRRRASSQTSLKRRAAIPIQQINIRKIRLLIRQQRASVELDALVVCKSTDLARAVLYVSKERAAAAA